MNRFEWTIALRFLKHDRNQTLFILMAITLGVTVLIFLESLIVSLQLSLIDDTIGASPHIVAEGKGRIAEPLPDPTAKGSILGDFRRPTEPVDSWLALNESLGEEEGLINLTAVLESPALIERGQTSQNLIFRGVQLDGAGRLYHLDERLLTGASRVSGRNVIIGAGLAKNFDLAPGDSIRVSFPGKASGQWSVAGVVDYQAKGLNDSWVIADIAALQSFLGLQDTVTRFEAQVTDINTADVLAKDLNKRFEDLAFRSWKEDNAQLLTALRSQSSSTSTISAFVLLSILMGISSVLGISVAQKNREIGILKAMGATSISSRSIFLIQGLVLGFGGAIAGAAGGRLLIAGFTQLTKGSGGLSFAITVPPDLIPRMVIIVTVCGLISAWIPSNKSATLNPIEVIRNG